jgi:nucleotide-binding universal stress UspA family protein
MYSRILVPLDGSEVAECVLPHVEAFSSVSEPVSVTFLYIVQPLDVPMTGHEYKDQIESEATSAAQEYLDELIEKLEYKEKVHGKVILGKVAESILSYATDNKADIIIMASHGRSGIGQWIRGSVADKVLHISHTPILRIRAAAPRESFYRKNEKITVLVPLDGSEVAEKVLVQVQQLASHFGRENVEIVLFRVCELFTHPHNYPPQMSMSYEEYLNYETKRCTEICQTYLSEVEGMLKTEGLQARSEVVVGNVADETINYINESPVDLVIMSTHGRTGISRWAFGSIAEKVLKGTSIPTMLVRSVPVED